MKRDLVTIDDLSDETLLGLMDLADRIRRQLRGHAADLPGTLMGSLFLEPSTRTRLSFETAMLRLGGRVITSSDPKTSSASKGESLSDTIRIVDSYVDLTILRHPAAGAARAAAQIAEGPVINAGDGSHEHPTQTLCDLYALRCERGRLADLRVALYGDLRYGRTTHSLARALVRFGASVLAISQGDLQLPKFVLDDLRREPGYAVAPVALVGLESVLSRPEVPALWISRGAKESSEVRPMSLDPDSIDAIYVTRLQKERMSGAEALGSLPILDHRFLAAPPFRQTVVLHPLPRVGEIARELDQDPRAAYFRQAALGVPIRMALILWCLGAVDLPAGAAPRARDSVVHGFRCENAGCISVLERGTIPPEVTRRGADDPRCAYCEETAVLAYGGRPFSEPA